MATLTKTLAGTWKAVIRKKGWPAASKTFRTKRNIVDFIFDNINNIVYICVCIERIEEHMKQSAFKRWLAAQGATFKQGSNHLKV